jgi:hypothetical protein
LELNLLATCKIGTNCRCGTFARFRGKGLSVGGLNKLLHKALENKLLVYLEDKHITMKIPHGKDEGSYTP